MAATQSAFTTHKRNKDERLTEKAKATAATLGQVDTHKQTHTLSHSHYYSFYYSLRYQTQSPLPLLILSLVQFSFSFSLLSSSLCCSLLLSWECVGFRVVGAEGEAIWPPHRGEGVSNHFLQEERMEREWCAVVSEKAANENIFFSNNDFMADRSSLFLSLSPLLSSPLSVFALHGAVAAASCAEAHTEHHTVLHKERQVLPELNLRNQLNACREENVSVRKRDMEGREGGMGKLQREREYLELLGSSCTRCRQQSRQRGKQRN